MIRGSVVRKLDRGIVVKVTGVPKQWKHSKAKDAEALVGKLVLVTAGENRNVFRLLRTLQEGEEVTLRIGAADSGLGFPSGHAAVSAAIAATAAPPDKAGAPYALAALAVTVGWTRIYAGAHYPLDVVGGWALGCLVGCATAAVAGTS